MRGVGRGIMRGAGAPQNTWFTPQSIPGLTSWWDFADESTVTETSGNVEQIDSRVGGHTLSQATVADRPTYNSKAAGIAGHRTSEHTDAGNEHLDEGAPPTALEMYDPSGTDGYTQISCFDYKTLTPDAGVVSLSNDRFGLNEIGTTFRFRVDGTDKAAVTSATGLQVHICMYDGQMTGGTVTQRVDGSDTTDTANRGGIDTGTLGIGDSGFTQDMEVAEVATYDRELTAAQIDQFEGYLRGKWGAPV